MLALSSLPLAGGPQRARGGRGGAASAQIRPQLAPARPERAALGAFPGGLSAELPSAPARARRARRAALGAVSASSSAEKDVVAPPGSVVLVAGASGAKSRLVPRRRARAKSASAHLDA